MSIKSFRILWITVRIENKKFLKIPLPLPLCVFQELSDCFLDIINAAYAFTPKADRRGASYRSKIYSAKALVIVVMKLLDHLGGDEPYDLVDAATEDSRVSIKVR